MSVARGHMQEEEILSVILKGLSDCKALCYTFLGPKRKDNFVNQSYTKNFRKWEHFVLLKKKILYLFLIMFKKFYVLFLWYPSIKSKLTKLHYFKNCKKSIIKFYSQVMLFEIRKNVRIQNYLLGKGL